MNAVFRPQFWIDLEEGIAYLAEKASAETATAWHESVFATVRLLQEHPMLGRARPDLRPGGIRTFRLKRYPKYLVFYRALETELEILRVKHSMMDLPGLFPQ